MYKEHLTCYEFIDNMFKQGWCKYCGYYNSLCNDKCIEEYSNYIKWIDEDKTKPRRA